MKFILLSLFALQGACLAPAVGDDVTFEQKKEAARIMLEAYVSSKSKISDLQDVIKNSKILLADSLPGKVVEEILFNAISTVSGFSATDLKTASKTEARSEEKSEAKRGYDETGGYEERRSTYADKHIRGMMNAIVDPDCMSRDFNVRDASYDPKEARKVFKKCKLLVLRNVFPTSFMNEYRKNFTEFIGSLHTGRISQEGTTTNGDYYFLHDIDHKRWEVALPKSLAHPNLLVNKKVMDVLTDRGILGSTLTLHSLGTAIAEHGANAQRWHKDEDYIFLDDSLKTSGVAGHDLPSYAVTMMVPLLNMTHEHGPTEFCMGTSYLSGFEDTTPDVQDESLTSKKSNYVEYTKFMNNEGCPPRFWRSPHLNFGDMLLFDYQLLHRGGQNISPDLRAIMYMTYSRSWYKDSNFKDEEDEDEDDSSDDDDEEGQKVNQWGKLRKSLLRTIMKSARFALPNKVEPCDAECKRELESMNLERIDELIRNERFQYRWGVDEEQMKKRNNFLISNIDFEGGKLQVMVNGTKVGNLETRGTLRVAATLGQHVEVRSQKGFVYKEWDVAPDQGQLIVSKDTIKLPVEVDGNA